MKREFLKKAGKSETEIQQELDKIYPDNINARIGEFGEEKKQWKRNQKLQIDWRMPVDSQRVMIFE
jgi:uncharacterized phage-like protein YoqJ